MIILEMGTEVKVTVTQKCYATLSHSKMHPHTEVGISTLKKMQEICSIQDDSRNKVRGQGQQGT